ncbi:MAG: SlyX family protein [Verrucomicrobia bacterium]|nr:SlyX family protein [Verrucomicrobiota bacterium]
MSKPARKPPLDDHVRLVQIESHLAHVERLCEELNKVLVAQGRIIARLQAQQRKLSESIESQEGERIRQTNPRPPHYQ